MKAHAQVFAAAWRLGLIATTTVAIVVAVAHATAPVIARNQQAAFVASLTELAGVPVSVEDVSAAATAGFTICAAEAIAVTRGTARGYGGDIELLLARDARSVRGVRVTRHQETPGIGDVVDHDRSSWIDGFVGWPLNARVDAVTGATITTRAVINAVSALASEPFMTTRDCES